MPDRPPDDLVTRILDRIDAGDRAPASELLPLLYDDLRRLAAARMNRLAPGQTMQATELVHDAFLRLVRKSDVGWQGRAHFFGAAARAMRDIVADHLKHKDSLKRGGHLRRVGEDTAAGLACDGPTEEVLEVEAALEDFERDYPRRAEVVTLMFYGGLGTAEVAEVLDLSQRTVERDWRFAKAWLNARLRVSDAAGPDGGSAD